MLELLLLLLSLSIIRAALAMISRRIINIIIVVNNNNLCKRFMVHDIRPIDTHKHIKENQKIKHIKIKNFN